MRYAKAILLAVVVLWAACAGGATYYCDLASDYTDATGADHTGNEYTGVGGLQAAIRGTGNATALAAGDTLYLKSATGNLGRLVKIVGGKDISAWSLGDEVRDNGGGALLWSGVVCETNVGAVNTTILVETDSAYTRATVEANKASGINNTTAVDTTTIASTAADGIQIDSGNDGDTVSGNIKIIGCASDWSTGNGSTSYCATLDGQSVATNCAAIANSQSYGWLENLILENATGDGLTSVYTSSNWVHRFLVAQNNGGDGFNLADNMSALIEHCVSSGNTTSGFNIYNTTIMHSCSLGDGAYGFRIRAGNSVACLASDAGNDGWLIHTVEDVVLVHCTSDGSQTGSGARTQAGRVKFWHCRFTNNAEHGIEMDSAIDDRNIEDYNVFYNNTNGDRQNIVAGANSRTAASAAECGYVDQPGGDFTLTGAAIMAGTDAAAIALDWTTTPTNTGYYTAGIPRRTTAGGAILKTGGKQ